MTTQTLTIADFLLARIAEDEALAREVVADMSRWDVPVWGGEGETDAGLPGPRLTARMSPGRVLAECAAKRRIVEMHDDENDPSDCIPWGRRPTGEPCETLLALGRIYRDHPDHREEWA